MMLRQVARAVPSVARRVGLCAASVAVSRVLLSQAPRTCVRFASSQSHSHTGGEHAKPAARRIPYYTRHEVAKHNHEEDCWIIIHNKVYNITEWAPRHPGGEIILAHAGGDSTSLFEQMNHSSAARAQMNAFLVGELDPKELKLRADLSGIELTDPDEVVFDKEK